ncbi:MAG: HAD-IIB family hydrolase [Betaproteobacteria bacterium]|nr:HAD-IIB family hydrolase [Betaproteobacteria bacterium]
MRPVTEIPAAALPAIAVMLCDIDDTLTTDGHLTAAAYAAMERLSLAGIRVVPVTGRPAGWCDHIARMWPVAGVVGENGAFYFCYDRKRHRMTRVHAEGASLRESRRRELLAIGGEILREVPGSALAADQPYRETDLAIDYCEDVPRLPADAVQRIAALMRERGLNAKVSSIHVNGWFGDYDKLAMSLRLLREQLGIDADADARSCVFIGDSPNDAPMFGKFPLSVGVANVRKFSGSMEHQPKYVTNAASGAGFCELAGLLLTGR